MIAYIVRVFVSAIMIATVSEVARRSPRLGAVLLTLPIISIIAFGATWFRDHDLKALSQMAKETLVLVPLGLPFFVPLAFADRWGLGWVVLGRTADILDLALAVADAVHQDRFWSLA